MKFDCTVRHAGPAPLIAPRHPNLSRLRRGRSGSERPESLHTPENGWWAELEEDADACILQSPPPTAEEPVSGEEKTSPPVFD